MVYRLAQTTRVSCPAGNPLAGPQLLELAAPFRPAASQPSEPRGSSPHLLRSLDPRAILAFVRRFLLPAVVPARSGRGREIWCRMRIALRAVPRLPPAQESAWRAR